MKKIMSFLCIVICLFLFVGCSTVTTIVMENSDGSFIQQLQIDLNATALGSAGLTNEQITQLKNNIKTEASTFADQKILQFRSRVNMSKTTTEKKTQLLKNFKSFVEWNDNTFVMRFSCADEETYHTFIGYDETEPVSIKIEQEFFVTKYIQTSNCIYSQAYKDNKTVFEYFNNKYEEYITTNFGAEAFKKLPEINYNYSILTQDNRLHSNANEIFKTSNGTVHLWSVTNENINSDLVFYTQEANKGIWYLLALCIALIFVVIYLIVLTFAKQQKTYNVEFVNKKDK